MSEPAVIEIEIPAPVEVEVVQGIVPVDLGASLRYLGFWDAGANDPDLADGTGTNGRFYIVSVGGDQDLGSGTLSFNVGDLALYDDGLWVRVPIREGDVRFVDVIDCSGNPNYPAAEVGDLYRVSAAGKIGGASGTAVEVGDEILCTTANAGGTQAAVGGDFSVSQANIDGAVIGPAVSVDKRIARFNGTTGKLIEDSGFTIPASGDASSSQVPRGDDSRMTNARTPTAHKTSHEPGGSDAMTVDAAAATGSLRTLGTGAAQAAPGNDDRIAGLLGAYQVRLALRPFAVGSAASSATTFLLGPVSALTLNTNASSAAMFYLDPADLPNVTGYLKKLRIRFLLQTDTTAPAANFTVALCPVATWLSPAANNPGIATVGASLGSAVHTAPGASSPGLEAHSADIAYPAAGFYVLTFVVSVNTAVNSVEQCNAGLDQHYVPA